MHIRFIDLDWFQAVLVCSVGWWLSLGQGLLHTLHPALYVTAALAGSPTSRITYTQYCCVPASQLPRDPSWSAAAEALASPSAMHPALCVHQC